MSFSDYKDSDVKTKSYKKSKRSWTGPCGSCHKTIKGVEIESDGTIKCPECDSDQTVAKKL